MSHKAKTHEQYIEELKEVHPDIIALTFYSNYKTKMKFKHLTCGTEWWALPRLVVMGKGCPECEHDHQHDKKQKNSLDRFLERLKEKCGNLIEYVSGFSNMSTKCFFRCKICGYIWKAKPTSVINSGSGCPSCAIKNRMAPLDEIKEKVYIISKGTIEYVSGYCGTNKKCKWRCTVCKHEWETRPSVILSGCGCPNCYILRKRLSIDEIIEEVEKVHEHRIGYVCGYLHTHTKCVWECRICKQVWDATPNNIMNGHGCPFCIKKSMEKPVKELLDKKEINFDYDKPLKDCVYDKKPLRPDFYIETEKGILWIECDGQQHYFPIYGKEAFEDQLRRDSFKNNYCKENNICLIRVTSSNKWGTEKYITLDKLIELIKIGINSETKEIDFDLFWQYDFNKE